MREISVEEEEEEEEDGSLVGKMGSVAGTRDDVLSFITPDRKSD